ncbi:MAG: regulatory protein RecX [Acidobacteriota bacterium]
MPSRGSLRVRPRTAPGGDPHPLALELLGRRAYSVRELVRKLEDRGFSAAVAHAEARRLEASGLLDDSALAHALVATELRRGKGRRAAAVALRRRGVRAEPREAALEGIDPEDEAKALSQAVERACAARPEWRRLPGERRKVVRYLLARGFGIAQVLDELARREGESE